MIPQPLLLLGAGGFAREAAEAVRAANCVAAQWNLLGFLDDDSRLVGAVIDGTPILGPIEALADHPDAQVVVCVGRPENYTNRQLIVSRMQLDDERFGVIIHPAASVGSSCRIGSGSVVLAHSALTASVTVGRHVAIMPGVVLTHDVRVDDYVTLASGVTLGGGVHVQQGAYLGSSSSVREGLVIGAWSLIGMGSVVTKSVLPNRVSYGVPAREIGVTTGPPAGSQVVS